MRDVGGRGSTRFSVHAAVSMDSYQGNWKAGTKNIFYTASFIPPPPFPLLTGASSHINHCDLNFPKHVLLLSKLLTLGETDLQYSFNEDCSAVGVMWMECDALTTPLLP